MPEPTPVPAVPPPAPADAVPGDPPHRPTPGDRVLAGLRSAAVWLGAVLVNFFVNGQLLILAVLTIVIVGPVLWFAYQFFFLLSAEPEVRAGLADSNLFLTMLYFFSKSTNFNEVWTILTPVIFAVSAGSSLETGLRTVSIFLFTVFFCTFIASEFVAHFFTMDAKFKELVENSANGKFVIDFSEFSQYATDVGKMCISAVSITLGISLIKK